jgi:predicted DNA-binding protein
MEARYDHLQDFHERTDIRLSFETVRRLIYLNKKLSALNLAIIMRKLDYTNAEIEKEILEGTYIVQSRTAKNQAKYLAEMINTSTETLTDRERVILNTYRILESLEPMKYNSLLDLIEFTAQSSGIDIHDQITRLRIKGTNK